MLVCLCACVPSTRYHVQLTLNGDPVYLSPLHFLCVNFGVPKLEPLERPAPPDDTIDPEDEALFIAAPHLFVDTAQSRLGTAATTAGTPGGDGASGGAGGGDNDSSSHSTPSHGRLGVDTAGVTSPIAVSPKPPGLSATGVLSATGGSVHDIVLCSGLLSKERLDEILSPEVLAGVPVPPRPPGEES